MIPSRPNKSANYERLPDSANLREPQVLELVGFSRSTLWRYTKSGQFPKPVKAGPGITVWKMGVVRAWLSEVAA